MRSLSLTVALRQRSGNEDIGIVETVWFDGLDNLPNDIAAWLRYPYHLCHGVMHTVYQV